MPTGKAESQQETAGRYQGQRYRDALPEDTRGEGMYHRQDENRIENDEQRGRKRRKAAPPTGVQLKPVGSQAAHSGRKIRPASTTTME